ncbi:MAG TPA: CHASE4 domain-containing protein [Candidatus Omnitrophota bacterium]|nr:CHASE4 domain-containing protein [Candidatus Omnitrophota bacterium]
MTFKTKIILIIFIVFMVFYGLSDVVARRIVLDRFDGLEKQNSIMDMGRILYFMDDNYSMFDHVVRDWATWDDAYAFIKNNNPGFKTSNLVPQTFDNLKIGMILFSDEKGKIVYSSEFTADPDTLSPIDQVTEKNLIAGFTCPPNKEETHGLILTPRGAMMVVARQILKSDRSGPPRGTLMMGRFLDSSQVDRLVSVTHILATAYPLNAAEPPPEVKDVLPLLAKTPIILRTGSADDMFGYLLMNDIFRKPAIVIKAELPRDLHFQSIVFYDLLTLNRGGMFLLAAITVIILLQYFVVRPIDQVNRQLKQITDKCGIVHKTNIPRGDELKELQGTVESMISELDRKNSPN